MIKEAVFFALLIRKVLHYNRHWVVHLKKEANWLYIFKEANWLSIQIKRQIGCQFKERANQPPVTIHPTSVSQKRERKGEGVGCWGDFLYLFWERKVRWITTGGLLTLSSKSQPNRLFLLIQYASFSKFTAKSPLSSNLLLSVYYCCGETNCGFTPILKSFLVF